MRTYLLSSFAIILSLSVFGQESGTKWKTSIEARKVFIENKSQFNSVKELSGSEILFGTDESSGMIYFTRNGVAYRFTQIEHKKEKHEGKGESYEEREKKEHQAEIKSDVVQMQWENSNPSVEVIPMEPETFYYSYSVGEQHFNHVKGYKKLLYKNLYPNIDAEYIFHPVNGIKYSLILHPGADISQVRMKYSDTKKVFVDHQGNVHLSTLFGDIVDHAPYTTYELAHSEAIFSRFIKTGKTVSFELGGYDHSQKVIIDPWTVTPTMPNANIVYYIKSDSIGNSYLFGGDNPIRLQKYDPSGSLVWTYNTPWTTGSVWFGASVADHSGNSYITDGTGATLRKIDPSGAFVWSNSSGMAPLNSIEYWALALNCDETQVYVAGSRHIPFSFDFNATVFKMNMTNGAVASYSNVAHKAFCGLPTCISEVRSMCSSPDGNLYYLTMDTVGGLTPTFTFPFRTSTTYNFPYYMLYSSPSGSGQGQNNICANAQFIYTTDGGTLHKRNIATGAILATATIPGGAANNNSGVAVDSCGNVYAGAQARVAKFDANLTYLSAAATPEPVYDVSIGINGDVLACGHNFAVALAMGACSPLKARCYTSFSALATHTNANCNLCNGSATATPQSGSSPFTYAWSNAQTTQTINNLCAGTYLVTITDASASTATASVNVIQTGGSGTVNLAADKTIMCAGDSARICAPPGYSTYTWNNGETDSCIYARQAGNYYVTATDAGNCTVTSNHLALNVYPLPPVSISVNGDTLTAYNAVTYQWYLNNNAIPGATSNIYITQQSGDYSVAVTDSNGCKAISTKVTVVTGINDLQSGEGLKVYPNPLESGLWNLECGGDMVGSKVEIFDNNGRLVYTSEIRNLKSEIGLNAARGAYWLRISSDRTNVTFKLLKL